MCKTNIIRLQFLMLEIAESEFKAQWVCYMLLYTNEFIFYVDEILYVLPYCNGSHNSN